MTEQTVFGKGISAVLRAERSEIEVKVKKTRSESPRPYITAEVDPTTKLDIVLSKHNGKDGDKAKITHKLWIAFSAGTVIMEKNGKVMPDEFILEMDGLKEFFRSAIHKDESITINSTGANTISYSNADIWLLKKMVSCKNIGYCIRDYPNITFNKIIKDFYGGLYYNENEFRMPWDKSRICEEYPWYKDAKEENRGWEPITIEELFSAYKKNTSISRRTKEMERQGVNPADLNREEKNIIDAIETYYDLPFAVKCIKEYKENIHQFNGLTSNSIIEFMEMSKNRESYSVDSNGTVNTYYSECKGGTRPENRVQFVDKKAWWRYIMRAAEEEYMQDRLGQVLEMWKEVLMIQIYTYGHITNMYPSRYKYVKDDEGDMVKIPCANKPLSFLHNTSGRKARVLEAEIRDGRLAEILGKLAELLECTKVVDGTKYILKCIKTEDDFLQEASNQENCVNDVYKGRILKGQNTSIFSIRRADEPDKSFITVEIDPLTGEIPQALKKRNTGLSPEETRIKNIFEIECMKRIKNSKKPKKEKKKEGEEEEDDPEKEDMELDN